MLFDSQNFENISRSQSKFSRIETQSPVIFPVGLYLTPDTI